MPVVGAAIGTVTNFLPRGLRADDGIAAELRGMTKVYDNEIVALRDVDLAIERGKVTALLGPNGAGKTTAVKLLLGLTSPTSGTATVFGNDPRSTRTRARIGAMLQVGKVPETIRVREHVELFRSYYPAPMTYGDVIDAAGLAQLDNRLYGTLSGGEKQRVLFALALCGNPDLMMLDEPTVGLDVESRRTLWDRIGRLAEAGRAILLTTHYLEEADSLASRIVVIARGQVVADGTPTEIKSNVARRRVRVVTALSLGEIQALSPGDIVRKDDNVTEILTSRSDHLVRALISRDLTLRGLEVGGAALEDAFLALTTEPSA